MACFNRITSAERGRRLPAARPSLSEAAQANMEAFLEYILLVLPALRIDSFIRNTRPKSTLTTLAKLDDGEACSPIFELTTPKHGIYGTAVLDGDEFVVQAGSRARKTWKGAATHTYAALHVELVKRGLLVEDGEFLKFVENYAFKSTSTAGAVLNGRTTNGQNAWRVKETQKTYREWEAEKLFREEDNQF